MRLTFTHFEVLYHHLTHGTVWDGDQISKTHRDHLCRLGMLKRVEGTGHHALTKTGAALILRKRAIFLTYHWTKRLPTKALRTVARRLREAALNWRVVTA